MSDVAEIKRTAAGRWAAILSAVAGIPADVLDGQHHPCPKCGGTDRFRALDDFRETGAVYCNQCFSTNNGDGIAAVQHFAGVDFKTAVRTIEDQVGMMNGDGYAHTMNGLAKRGAKKPANVAALTRGIEPIDAANHAAMLQMYCNGKPPITATGIKECGGVLVRWHDHQCIRLDGRAPIDNQAVTAVVLLRTEGTPFPAFGKLKERKTHTAGGSVNSWISTGDVATATTIFDVEGVTDLLAVASAGLPPGWVAVTNTAGAKARGKLPRQWAAGKTTITAGDADKPGVEGQRKSAAAYHRAGATMFLAHLPYPVQEDHGKDFRDYLNNGGMIAELPTVEVTAEQSDAWRIAKPPQNTPEREITIGTDESRVVDEAIEALATRENVYQRGGCLVQVVEGTSHRAALHGQKTRHE